VNIDNNFTRGFGTAVCEFCYGLVLETDPHHAIFCRPHVYVFCDTCHHTALTTKGWFDEFWKKKNAKRVTEPVPVGERKE
jgi:hypothetical protein